MPAPAKKPGQRVRIKRLPDGTVLRVTVYDSRKKPPTPGKGKNRGTQ